MNNRAKFRVAGVTWEQAIIAFLTKFPNSTAEEVNEFTQHPELKNFSTILSAMKKDQHIKRSDTRPAQWSVKSTNKIHIPDLEVTEKRPALHQGIKSPTSNLAELVQNVLSAEMAAKVARGAFDAMLPGLDTESRNQLFNMLARNGKPVVENVPKVNASPPPPTEQTTAPRNRKKPRSRKRSSDEIESVVRNIVGLLRRSPDGMRAEQIREELGVEAKELPRPIQVGLDSRAFVKRGVKRSTTYFLTHTKKGTTKSFRTKKSTGMDTSEESADEAPNLVSSVTEAGLTPKEVEKAPVPSSPVTLEDNNEDYKKLVFEAIRSFGTKRFKLGQVCEKAGLSSMLVQPIFTQFRKEGIITQGPEYTTHNREWVNVLKSNGQKSAHMTA